MADENMMDMDMQGMLYTLEDEEGNEQEFEFWANWNMKMQHTVHWFRTMKMKKTC